jgi:hypothetical protein
MVMLISNMLPILYGGNKQYMSRKMVKNVRLSDEVHKELTDMATWGETINDVIHSLIVEHKRRQHTTR